MPFPSLLPSCSRGLGAVAAALAFSAAAVGCMPQQTAPPPASSGERPIATSSPMTTSAPPPPPAAGASTGSTGSTGSTSQGSTASAQTYHAGPADRRVYRLDFVLTTTDGSAPPVTTSFTLNLGEHDKGEVHVGKNVALYPSPPSAAGAPAASPARQDVGLKVGASFQSVGDELYLDVSFEMSAFDAPSTIRKVVERGRAVAMPGKASLITSLDEDHKHYQLTVTPTKLR